MSSTQWQRRAFLRALGTGAAALPFYRLLESSAVEGQDGTPPMRVVMLYTMCSGRWDYLRPRVTGNDVALTAESLAFDGSILAPLSAHVSRMTVLEGMSMHEGLLPNSPGGPGTLYVGHDHTAPNAFTGAAVGDDPWLPSGPSLDQVLAVDHGDTVVRSLALGIGSDAYGSQYDVLSYDTRGQRVPSLNDPAETFRALFGDVGPVMMEGPVDRRPLEERAILDAAQAGAERLRGRLGMVEQQKLDAHIAALADIERRLAAADRPLPISCGTPRPPGETAGSSEETFELRTDLQFDNIAQALACDRTRFAIGSVGPFRLGNMRWLDPTATHAEDLHEIAHSVGGDQADPMIAGAERSLATLNRWYATKIARFMDQLAAVPESNGSVLDNTLIVWAGDFGEDVHGGLNVPYILLGGAQNKLKMGRYYNFAPDHGYNDVDAFTPNNHLFVSILQAFGMETNEFNSTTHTGPISELMV